MGDARPDPVASSDNGTFIFSLAYLDEAPPAITFTGIVSRWALGESPLFLGGMAPARGEQMCVMGPGGERPHLGGGTPSWL